MAQCVYRQHPRHITSNFLTCPNRRSNHAGPVSEHTPWQPSPMAQSPHKALNDCAGFCFRWPTGSCTLPFVLWGPAWLDCRRGQPLGPPLGFPGCSPPYDPGKQSKSKRCFPLFPNHAICPWQFAKNALCLHPCSDNATWPVGHRHGPCVVRQKTATPSLAAVLKLTG